MNERIKELWTQGTFTVVPREGDYSSVSAKNIEKFAELIIEECSEYLRTNGAAFLVQGLKEHFGVE